MLRHPGTELAARSPSTAHGPPDEDALVGVLAHELRTPITTIYAGSAVLAREDDDLLPAMRRELASGVHAEAARLFRAVEDLLVLTRLEHDALLVTWEPISLVRAVDAAAESEGARWPAIHPILRLAGPLPPAAGDTVALAHVLRNLIADIGWRATDPIDLEIAVDADERRVSCRLMDTTQTLVDAELADYFALPLAEPRPGRVSPGIAVFVAGALVDAMGGSSWARRTDSGAVEIGFALPRYEAA
jgi:two-component system sensor histidine kinase KdpD